MPPPPLRLPLSIYEVRDWSIEVVVTSRSGTEWISVGIRFNHEQDVWIFAHVESLEEANHWLTRIQEGQVTLEEIMATPQWGHTFAPEDPALSHLAQSRVIRSIAFTRPFTAPGHWSIVPIDTTTLIRGRVDIGIRLDHAEYISLFEEVLSPFTALSVFIRIATGRITLQEILEKPKSRTYRIPEGEHELSGSITRENLKARALQILWTLQRLCFIASLRLRWDRPIQYVMQRRIMALHRCEQARALEEYNRHLARLTQTLPSAPTQEALDESASEESTSPSPLPSLCQIPTTPGVLLEPWVVKHYVRGCSFAGGETGSGGPPTILGCWAMMSKAAEEKLHNWIAEDDRPIIYVKLQGPFLIGRLGATVERAEEVFDAQTGDLLMWGVTD